MQTLRDIPVIWSLYLIILLVSAGSLLYASVSYYMYCNFELQKAMVTELESLAQIAGLSSSDALLADNRAGAAKSLSALKANKNIVAADIYDKKGELFASFSRYDKPGGSLSDQMPNNTHYFDDQYLHLFCDITINNSKAGSISIVHDAAVLRSQKWKFLCIAALIFVSCMGLIALPSLFLQGIISAPILILASTMQKITRDKDYTFRMLKGTNREMGLLINDFNKMMHAILSHSLSFEKQAAQSSAEMQTTQRNLLEERRKLLKAEHQIQLLTAMQGKSCAEGKMLSGIVPICSSCKKIRDEQGYWLRIETYLNKHTQAEFSHDMCPECSKKLYQEMQQQMHPEKK